MDHTPGSDTFQKNYLSRNVGADLWAIHRDAQPQHALIQQAISHGYSKEMRRPIDLTPEQTKAAVDDNTEYRRLTEAFKGLPNGPEYDERRKTLFLQCANLRAKLRNRAIERVRAEWNAVQSVNDIERQIQGGDFSSLPKDQPRVCRPMGASQRQMFEAVTMPLDNEFKAVVQRKVGAINALIAYCDIQEPHTLNSLNCRKRRLSEAGIKSQPEGKNKIPRHQEEPTEQLKKSVSAQAMDGGSNVRKCFVCVAKAILIPQTESVIESLCRDFYNKGTLARHFVTVHLQPLSDDSQTECPICDIPLVSKMHVQNHAEAAHGIRTVGYLKPKTQH